MSLLIPPAHLHVGPPEPEFSKLATYFSDSNNNVYVRAALGLGDAVASRLIIVAIAGNSGSSSRTISSVTVGGNALNEDVFYSNSGNSRNGHVGIYSASLPSGSSGDVVVTWSGTMLNTMIGIYRAAYLASNSMFDFDPASDGDGQSSMSLNIPEDGVAVGCAAMVTGPSSATWSGLTEDDDRATGEGESLSVASAGILSAETGRAITVSTGSDPSRYVCASYG